MIADEYITTTECALRIGVSRRTFDQHTKHSRGFPEAFRPSPRVVRWHWPSVDAWRAAQVGYSIKAISSALSA